MRRGMSNLTKVRPFVGSGGDDGHTTTVLRSDAESRMQKSRSFCSRPQSSGLAGMDSESESATNPYERVLLFALAQTERIQALMARKLSRDAAAAACLSRENLALDPEATGAGPGPVPTSRITLRSRLWYGHTVVDAMIDQMILHNIVALAWGRLIFAV
jgi:hypothetical protein